MSNSHWGTRTGFSSKLERWGSYVKVGRGNGEGTEGSGGGAAVDNIGAGEDS